MFDSYPFQGKVDPSTPNMKGITHHTFLGKSLLNGHGINKSLVDNVDNVDGGFFEMFLFSFFTLKLGEI